MQLSKNHLILQQVMMRDVRSEKVMYLLNKSLHLSLLYYYKNRNSEEYSLLYLMFVLATKCACVSTTLIFPISPSLFVILEGSWTKGILISAQVWLWLMLF